MAATYEDRLKGAVMSAAYKAPVRVATTANITLSGEQTIDGVAVVADDRVLVKSQIAALENGIYVASASAWERATDFNGARDVVTGTLVYVNSGTLNGGYTFRCTNTNPVDIGNDSLTFVRHGSSLGSSADNYLALAGSATGSNPQYVTIQAVGATNTSVGINHNAIGTTTVGYQYNGLLNGVAGSPTTGRQIFNIAAKPVLHLTDTYWNPDAVYNGTYYGYPVISSGFGTTALTTDMIAGVISVESPYYGATGKNGLTVDGLTLMIGAKGTTGSVHFLTNGVLAHVNIAAVGNSVGTDKYQTAESQLWFYGCQTGGGTGAVIATQGGTSYGTKFYDSGTGGYEFLSDNTSSRMLRLTRRASGVNGIDIISAATTQDPTIAPYGSDTDIGLLIKTKGATNQNISFYDASAIQFQVGGSSSATSFLAVTGGVNTTAISAQGGSNPSIVVYTIGTGGIDFKTSNTTNTILQLKDSFDVVIGNGSQTTSATAGFLFIPSCAGAPTGVPASIPSNRIALMYDRTNNKLYAYNGAWKSTAALT
jgi:hypothetical protein